jgi:hypothetical protein
MKIGRRNRSTRRKPIPMPFCLPLIPHGLTWARIQNAAVGSGRLTACAMARLRKYVNCKWRHNYCVCRHYPSSCFYLKHSVSETYSVSVFSWAKSIVRPKIESRSVDWVQLSRLHLKTETESSLRSVAYFKNG